MKNSEGKKRGRAPKKVKKKADSWTDQEVIVHTGLPPKVEGQLRCYLKLTVSQILWLIPNPPDVTHARVQWWGEDTEGAIYRPVDVKQGSKGVSRTIGKYAIRSGPKQFAAYLSDMSSLVFEVLSGPMMVVVGRAQVEQIGTLSPSRPINGFFPVLSADNEKIAELQISAVLESIMASYDSVSSVPTVDMSSDVYDSVRDSHPMNPFKAAPAPFPRPKPVPNGADDPFTSPAVPRNTPRGIDQQMFRRHNPLRDSLQSYGSAATMSSQQSIPPTSSSNHGGESSVYPRTTAKGARPAEQRQLETTGSTLNGVQSLESDSRGLEGVIARGQSVQRPHAGDLGGESQQSAPISSASSGQTDVVSALLERGSKLKEAMIISTLEQPKSTDDVSSVDGGQYISPRRERGSTSDQFRDMVPDGRRFGGDSTELEMVGQSMDYDTDGRVVDLVVGPTITDSEFQLLKANGLSPRSSISIDDITSDIGDPLHDESILQELFYKENSEESDIYISDGEESKVSLLASKKHAASLEDLGNRRPPSRTSSRCSSVSSVEREPVRDRSRTPPRKKSSKKGKKKRKKRGATSDVSDSDSVSRLSESSRVSFDPAPSDAEETPKFPGDRSHLAVDGMSVQRLTLLGRVHVARVVVDNLQLHEEPSLDDSLSSAGSRERPKFKSRGRPPRPSPKSKKNLTYFVEYQFPVVATSRDKYQPNAMATEVMRVASKKVVHGIVSFGHRSVFPVLFDGESIEKWWKSALIFKVYSKSAGQKVPRLMGMCSVPLKSVLKSEALFLEKMMDVRDRSQETLKSGSKKKKQKEWPEVGNLRVTIELASDSRDFSTALAKTRLAEMTNPKIVPIPQPLPSPKAPRKRSPHRKGVAVTMETQTEPRPTNIDDLPLAVPDLPRESRTAPPLPPLPQTRPKTPPPAHVYTSQQSGNYQQQEPYEPLTLHTLLMVPEGSNITPHGVTPTQHGNKSPSSPPKPLTGWTGRDMATRNLYLVCRMFWCDDVSRSNVVWGSFDPEFNFVQVAPVLLTASLLERMRDNVMVAEVWDKKTSSENDHLVGIVKLPIHQFYMSFRDRKIANSLLRSQYPVVAVDSDLPIINPFSGAQFGHIKVLLAIGSGEQVNMLQRLKLDKGAGVNVPSERPSHYLERQHVYPEGRSPQEYGALNNMIEHTFEVSVEGIKSLQLLDTMTWGEADCFIQYHFPVQTHTTQQDGHKILHATPSLKTFRTATTLCVPDPMFNDVLRHKVSLPEGTPVQREILTACAGVGGGVGGIPFEVWCRYYHPNVRDQVIAKSTLPLAKLCAMVTMQKRGGPNIQSFTLPLSSLVPESERGDTDTTPMPETGLLEVTINYRANIIKGEPSAIPESVSRSLPGATVCISVGVVRSSGLQASAAALARNDLGLKYASEVGVNSYIRTKISFLPKEDERVTRTVARTFAPDYSFYMDFPCPLLWTEPGADVISLAELLENAEATFEVWHQSPTSQDSEKHHLYTGTNDVMGRRRVSMSGDILLGTATVPLLTLLTRKTGISGWYPINLPSLGWGTSASDQSEEGHNGNRGLERVVGGIEAQIKFAHNEDLERVVHAARGVGWSPDYDLEHRDWESADESAPAFHQVTMAVDLGCFPTVNALIPGRTSLDHTARCYVRYKLYNKEAVCSKCCEVEENDEGYLIADLQHSKSMILPQSSPFSWYLREERLEVQVWITHAGAESDKKRPRNKDKLIGTAQIDLAPLADARRRQHRVSGVYPLFKPGTSSLGGACIRAHVSLRPNAGGYVESDEESEEVYSPRRSKSPRHRSLSPRRKPSERDSGSTVDHENTFGAHVCIERALHLPTVYDKGINAPPNSYVTYQTSEFSHLTCTSIFPKSADPVWDHEHTTRLDRELLVKGTRHLVFKVWHRTDEQNFQPDPSVDRVLGFVSVDLVPLTTGFLHICGWYNIMDFSGQCQGQIKVAVTPHEALDGLRSGDTAAMQDVVTTMASYMTTGAYSQFPSHISWHPEQAITAMDTGSTLTGGNHGYQDTETGANLPNFSHHYENVKKYHIQLHQKMTEMGCSDPNAASRSILFQNLRTNMHDLDEITSNLKKKLYCAEPTTTASAIYSQPPAPVASHHPGSDHLLQHIPMTQAGSTLETDVSTHRTTDDTSGKLITSTTFIMGSDSGAAPGSTAESRVRPYKPGPSGYTPQTTGESFSNSVFDGTNQFTPREGDTDQFTPREADEFDPLTTGDSRRTDRTSDKSGNTESEYTRALERAQNLLQVISGGEGSVSPFTPRDPVTPRDLHLRDQHHRDQHLRDQHPRYEDLAGASQGSTLKGEEEDGVGGMLSHVDLGDDVRDSISDFEAAGDDVAEEEDEVIHSRIHAGDDSEMLDQDDTYANIWPSQREEQDGGSDAASDAEATFVQPRPLNDVSSANFANAMDTDTFGHITTITRTNTLGENTLGESDTYFEMTQTAPFSAEDFKFESTGNLSDVMHNISANVPRPSERFDFEIDNDLAVSAVNDQDESDTGRPQQMLARDEAEDPTVKRHASRTSLSDKQQQGKGRGKLARRAARHRREYDHHRHGNNSSSEEEEEGAAGSRERHRSDSRSRRSSQRSRSQSSQGSYSQARDAIAGDAQPDTYEERVAAEEEESDPNTVMGDAGSQPGNKSGESGSITTVLERARVSDSNPSTPRYAQETERDAEDAASTPRSPPLGNFSNNSSQGLGQRSATSSGKATPRLGDGADISAQPKGPSEIWQAMQAIKSPLPNGHVQLGEDEDNVSEASQRTSSSGKKYSKLAFAISAKNIPKPNSEQSKRIAKIFAQKFSKESK